MAQVAGDAEIERRAIDAPVEGERRVAERAEGDGHGRAPRHVVHDLVEGEDVQGVAARRPARAQHGHGQVGGVVHGGDGGEAGDAVGAVTGDRAGRVQREDAVAPAAAAHDLGEGYGAPRPVLVGPVAAEVGRRVHDVLGLEDVVGVGAAILRGPRDERALLPVAAAVATGERQRHGDGGEQRHDAAHALHATAREKARPIPGRAFAAGRSAVRAPEGR